MRKFPQASQTIYWRYRMENKFSGVLVGALYTPQNKVLIGLDVEGKQLALSLPAAALIFNQLGMLLLELGFFEDYDEDDAEEDEEEIKTVKRPICH